MAHTINLLGKGEFKVNKHIEEVIKMVSILKLYVYLRIAGLTLYDALMVIDLYEASKSEELQ